MVQDKSLMLLEVRDLCVKFENNGENFAVKDVNFSLNHGQTIAIVGESGSGKSVMALALTQLLPQEPCCRVTGEVVLEGNNILSFNRQQMERVRGRKIAYVFQDPSTSLNPVLSIGFQIEESVRLHQPGLLNKKAYVYKILGKVGLDASRCYKTYPFELSGGMQQRVMIAMALACRPQILVADEPTTALDVTIQKQVMDLIKQQQAQKNLSIILITHNMGLVKNFADIVLVMHKGHVVETGPTKQILYHAQHPYTQALIRCVPSLRDSKQEKLTSIEDILFL